MAGSVGCAIEADVVIPVKTAVPEVIDTPNPEVGTRVGFGTSDKVPEVVAAISLVGTSVGT